MPIDFQVADSARIAVASLERTEDVALTSDGRRLAVACFGRSEIALFDVDIRRDANGPTVTLGAHARLVGDAFAAPHGLCFLTDDRLLVANRAGAVVLVDVPPTLHGQSVAPPVLAAFADEAGAGEASPGSVALWDTGDGRRAALVCSNYRHLVLRYDLDPGPPVTVGERRTLLQRWMDIPDGVCVSPDGRWIGVSNHNMNSVLLYPLGPDLVPDADPVGILRGVAYPHGLAFSGDSRRLYVADAGSPWVHCYDGTDGWAGVHEPARSMRAMSQETYLRGRANPAEGGPKGLELHRGAEVLITTCEEQALTFLDAATPDAEPGADASTRIGLELDRRSDVVELTARARTAETDAVLARERVAHLEAALAESERARRDALAGERRLRGQRDRALAKAERAHARSAREAARADRAQARTAAVLASRSWRVTRPLRRLQRLGSRLRPPASAGRERNVGPARPASE